MKAFLSRIWLHYNEVQVYYNICPTEKDVSVATLSAYQRLCSCTPYFKNLYATIPGCWPWSCQSTSLQIDTLRFLLYGQCCNAGDLHNNKMYGHVRRWRCVRCTLKIIIIKVENISTNGTPFVHNVTWSKNLIVNRMLGRRQWSTADRL